jgi:hypothetical protein
MAQAHRNSEEQQSMLPEAFISGENERVQVRRAAAAAQGFRSLWADSPSGDGPAPKVGLALSGGGIRSATFCLGVLQGLCTRKILPQVDFLSTVSGGGYIGTWFSALVHRWGLKGADETLTWNASTPRSPASFRFSWLRENGSYLAPRGAGDDLLLAGIVLRNWMSVWVVLGTLGLALFLSMDLRWLLPFRITGGFWPVAGHPFWWSPWLWMVLLPLGLGAVPLGWAYWFVGGPPAGSSVPGCNPRLVGGLILVAAALLAVVDAGWRRWISGPPSSVWVPLVALAALEALGFVWYRAARAATAPFGDVEARSWLSKRLAQALTLCGVLGAAGLVDSAGQSAYAVLAEAGPRGFQVWLVGGLAGLAILVPVARFLLPLLGKSKKAPSLPLGLLASAAALLLWGTALVGLNTLAHGITFGFRSPQACQGHTAGWTLLQASRSQAATAHLQLPGTPADVYVDGRLLGTSPLRVDLPESRNLSVEFHAPCDPQPCGTPRSGLWLLTGLVMTWGTALLMGRVGAFLNQSAVGWTYGRRLVRTFLGASNKDRSNHPAQAAVRDDSHDDDLEFGKCEPWLQGGPLHWINATINETVDGKSQIVQHSRKGTHLAVGPCGISVGVRHHAQWQSEPGAPDGIGPDLASIDPEPAEREGGAAGWRVFPSGKPFKPEPLSLGQWMAVSGAAFGPGLGFKTHLGFSALFAFFNLRTGYWWFPGFDPRRQVAQQTKPARRSLGSLLYSGFSACFFVQAHFLEETLARFPGTARRHWYLSDGGHSENLAVYELARRKVEIILCCDCGEDAAYVFDDFANLALKLRADFGAELTFIHRLDEFAGTPSEETFATRLRQLDTLLRLGAPATGEGAGDAPWPGWESLRRGRWVNGKSGPELKRASLDGFSKAHWSLAAITYPGGDVSLLVLIKPALTGSEPMDLRYYHEQFPAFPQQSTADQFFDEAQWEAYRKLGEISVSGLGITLPGDSNQALGEAMP